MDQPQPQPPAPMDGQGEIPSTSRSFDLGPDHKDDLRLLRPYFIVPLDKKSPGEVPWEELPERIDGWLSVMAQEKRAMAGGGGDDKLDAPPPSLTVTDVFVLSHGWHRNFFTAVSAYDRFSSRMNLLLRRRRIQPKEPFVPLFLCLHWHSDPGEDQWVDPAGRRARASFLRNVEALLDPEPVSRNNGQNPAAAPADLNPGQVPVAVQSTRLFADQVEEVFELFSRMSAPGVSALTDPELEALSNQIADEMRNYRLRNAPRGYPSDLGDVSVTLWRCYHEATAQRVLQDQDPGERPAAFITRKQAQKTLFRFLTGTLGIAALASLALGWVGKVLALFLKPVREGIPADLLTVLILILAFACFAVLGWWKLPQLVADIRQKRRQAQAEQWKKNEGGARNHAPIGISRLDIPSWLSWACWQIWSALPLLGYCFWTYLFGGPDDGLFDERTPKATSVKIPGRRRDAEQRRITRARRPAALMKEALAEDSPARGLINSIDAQLAFWEMQQAGVDAGHHAAKAIMDLFLNCNGLTAETRFHFVGHSFGSLVLSNATQVLASLPKEPHDERQGDRDTDANATRVQANQPKRASAIRLQSLCLVQGALASNWFEKETALLDRLNTLACIYSRYDTANSFYYPMGNRGRAAAGYVGLLVPLAYNARRREYLKYPALMRPPALERPGDGKVIYNLDASRLIFEGPVALGGGHGDIFKDDVIHLIWGALGLQDTSQE